MLLGPTLTLLALAAYGAMHSLLAAHAAKRLARRAFGPAADRYYRLGYNLIAVVTLLPVLWVLGAFPGQTLYLLPWPWAGLSLAGQGAALVVLGIGFLQSDPWHFIGLRQLSQTTSSEQPRLVVSGLYRWVRHPLYTAGLAFVWLTPLLTTSLLAFNLGATAYLWFGSELEERRLVTAFGKAYLDYRARVPRLIPRLSPAPRAPSPP
ncbi:MAG: isoprenylcysteine carboxylmethyltransferase family protein [Chloroflexota bacterium]